MKKIVVINGPARSGKDTFIRMCRLLLQEQQFPVYTFSSIFPVKQQMITDGLWDGVSTKTTIQRKLMADIKQEMSAQGDLPNKYLVEQIAQVPQGLIFLHIREAQEITACLKLVQSELNLQPQTMHLVRVDNELPQFASGVDFESQTRQYQNYDFDIVNKVSGLEHVKTLAKNFLTQILPTSSFCEIDLSDLENSDLHQEFDDHLRRGII